VHDVGTYQTHQDFAVFVGLDADRALVVAFSNDWHCVAMSLDSAGGLDACCLLPQHGTFLPKSLGVSSLCSNDAFDCLPGSAARVDGASGAAKR
jgi:hypothetical protein